MRVVVDALAVTPARPGGDVTYVRQLVRCLPEVDPNLELVVLITPEAQSLFPLPGTNLRYIVCRIPFESQVVRALWEQLALPRLLRRLRPEVVHAPVNVAPLTTDAPVVLTLHEAEPFMPGNRIPLPLLGWWCLVRSQSARRAARVVTVSHAAQHDLERWMRIDRQKIVVVPLGVEPASTFAPPRVLNDPYLLWVGRSYPGKNLVSMIAAFGRLRSAGRPEQLVLIGPAGWLDAEVDRAIASSGCGNAIKRIGPMWSGLGEWYAGCEVFVYPSQRESFGLPVLEAMAHGVAVVAGDIPALREVGGNAAVYVDPYCTSDLYEALAALLQHRGQRLALGRAGRARAARFTWRSTALRTLAVYRTALSTPKEVSGSAGSRSRARHLAGSPARQVHHEHGC